MAVSVRGETSPSVAQLIRFLGGKIGADITAIIVLLFCPVSSPVFCNLLDLSSQTIVYVLIPSYKKSFVILKTQILQYIHP